MVNKKDLRGGAEKIREVAQMLCLWAEDLEAAAEKKGRKKVAEPAADPAVVSAADSAAEPVAAVEMESIAPADASSGHDEKVAARAEVKFEDLRGLLAEKSAAGYRTQVIALINSFGAEKLSGVDPAHYGELWDAASCLGGETDAG